MDIKLFSERLKELMFYNNDIKSEELAVQLGVAGSTVRGWCLASQVISLSNAIKLAEYFSCSLDYLFGTGENNEKVTKKAATNFYNRFRAVMKEKEITRYRITKETIIKDSYFTNWSKGADPSMFSVIEIAKYLDVSLDYLLGRE